MAPTLDGTRLGATVNEASVATTFVDGSVRRLSGDDAPCYIKN